MRRVRCYRLGLALALVLSGTKALAQEGGLPSPAVIEGIPVGPVYLQPFVGLGVSRETNPFFQTSAQSDTVARANPGLGILFPFLKSYLRASYEATFRHYQETQVTNSDSDYLAAELSMLFSTFDRLVILANRTSGASELLAFDGGETVYNGTPFRYGVYTMGAERTVAGHLGYQAVATWSRLSFDEADVNFFEYHGWDVTGDAYVPLSPYLWLVAGAKGRRYDHFRTDDPTDTVFRREESETLRGGVRGVFLGNRPYHVILGYDWARYPGGSGSDFTGLVGDAAVELPLGPSTGVTISVERRRWSSFYGDNNYYLANTARLDLLKRFRTGSELGVGLLGGVSAYPDPENIALGGPRRRDDLGSFEIFGTIALPRRCGIRMGYEAEFRHSNVPGVEYDAQTATVQFLYGWR
jgi:hypothetical protein